jgi:hypothetical protein
MREEQNETDEETNMCKATRKGNKDLTLMQTNTQNIMPIGGEKRMKPKRILTRAK